MCLPAADILARTLVFFRYYQAWVVVLLLCACNPEQLGAHAWEQYPTLQTIMKMSIIGNWKQELRPESSKAKKGATASVTESEERQLLQLERNDILHFEAQMAKASALSK